MNADIKSGSQFPWKGTRPHLPVVEAMIVGAAAGGSAVFLLHGIKALSSLRMALSTQYPAEIVLPAIGLAGGLISGTLVQLAPEVSGSGIPQVRALLSRINLKLDLGSAIAKLAGGIVAIGCGLFMGREGPTVQVGAAIAAQLSRWVPTSAQHRRQLIAAGAGAGLAAAFNAPLAGVTFVLEELLKEVSASTVAISLIACFSAAVVENVVGNPRDHSVIMRSMPGGPLQWSQIAFCAGLGLLAAFFGAAFNTLIMGFLRAYKQTRLPVVIKTSIAGLITGGVVCMLPAVFHNYAETRQLINTGAVTPDLVPLAFVSFFFLVLIAYGSGAPGGLFAPTLILGGALGYMVGYAHMQLFGTNTIDMFTQVGMGAFFAAVARVPLTSTVIVFEMSGNFGLIPPLMISSVIASSTAEVLSKGSLYDALMVWSGINLRGPKAERAAKAAPITDLLDENVPELRVDTTLNEGEQLFADSGFHRLPVVKQGVLVGVLSEDALDLAKGADGGQTTVEELMDKSFVAVSPFDDLEEILLLFSRYGYDWLPVTENGQLLGIVNRNAVMGAAFPPVSSVVP